MRTPLVAGNWKLHGSRESVVALADALRDGAENAAVEIAVCPSFVHLAEVGAALRGSAVALGAQDCAAQQQGAFTGEVAAAMLAEYGCRYAIVGHSERRSLFGDSDALVAEKFAAAQRAGLTPILCLGEQLAEREAAATESVLGRQLGAVLDTLGVAAFESAVIAYEPVWAIGTGVTASPEQAQAAHAYIRGQLAARDAAVAAGLRILYGGSVKPDNAAQLFACADIDGGLIGGASLVAEDFLNICRAAG